MTSRNAVVVLLAAAVAAPSLAQVDRAPLAIELRAGGIFPASRFQDGAPNCCYGASWIDQPTSRGNWEAAVYLPSSSALRTVLSYRSYVLRESGQQLADEIYEPVPQPFTSFEANHRVSGLAAGVSYEPALGIFNPVLRGEVVALQLRSRSTMRAPATAEGELAEGSSALRTGPGLGLAVSGGLRARYRGVEIRPLLRYTHASPGVSSRTYEFLDQLGGGATQHLSARLDIPDGQRVKLRLWEASIGVRHPLRIGRTPR